MQSQLAKKGKEIESEECSSGKSCWWLESERIGEVLAALCCCNTLDEPTTASSSSIYPTFMCQLPTLDNKHLKNETVSYSSSSSLPCNAKLTQ